MNLKGQNIRWLFTFVAALMILAHAVVPHHHHFELSHSEEQEASCESSAQDKMPEDQGSHCHAFNLLVSNKTTNSSLDQSLTEFLNFFLTGIIVRVEIPPVKNITTIIFGHHAIFLKQFFFIAHTLRAPPTV